MTCRSPGVRSQRTKASIRVAFASLVKCRGFAGVSVKEMCEDMGMHRTTFYDHYASKLDIAEDIFKDAVEGMIAEMRPPFFFLKREDLAHKSTDERATNAWARLFEHVASNRRMYREILSGDEAAWFQARIRRILTGSFGRRTFVKRRQAPGMPVEFFRWCYASLVVGIVQSWVEEDRPRYSASQMAAWFRQGFYEGFPRTLLEMP